MESEKDKIVQGLFEIVQQKKAEIAKAEKPSWETNCAFRFNKDASTVTNLQVCSSVEELVGILGFLIEKNNSFESAQKILGTKVNFKWLGFTVKEWTADIKTRIDKIDITNKKKELENLEGRLDKLVSKEMREQLELAEIKKLLES